MHIWSWSKNCVGLCDMCVCVCCQAPKPPDLTQESELWRATYRVVAQRAQNGECDAHQWPYPRSCSVYSLRGGRQIRPAKMSVISAVRGQFPGKPRPRKGGRKTWSKGSKKRKRQSSSPVEKSGQKDALAKGKKSKTLSPASGRKRKGSTLDRQKSKGKKKKKAKQ